MTRVIITGAKGRMGQALIACAKNFPELQVVAALGRGDDPGAVIAKSDVVIDFSSRRGTPGCVGLCAKNNRAIVIGAPGHAQNEREAILKGSSGISLVLASTFSPGVHPLFWLTRPAAEILGS